MRSNSQQRVVVGVAGVACAVCCAGPVIGFFAAIDIGTTVGLGGSLLAGVIFAVAGILLVRRRHRASQAACATSSTSVSVAAPTVRART